MTDNPYQPFFWEETSTVVIFNINQREIHNESGIRFLGKEKDKKIKGKQSMTKSERTLAAFSAMG